jgi:HEAT repeat protein
MTRKNLGTALESERWQIRVAALKIIDREGMDIAGFRAYEGLLESPRIVERYYVAKALGASKQPETAKQLLSFLDDPHINVVCMALDSLGRRGHIQALEKIMKVLETSDHWYEQWYAYKALRKLGWNQTGSK